MLLYGTLSNLMTVKLVEQKAQRTTETVIWITYEGEPI